LIDLPIDVQLAEIEFDIDTYEPLPVYKPFANKKQIEKAMEMLMAADKPLIVSGGGVINADASLYSTDFRASERLFANLMQVSGRAGRADLPGRVLIQTEFPEHPLYGALRRQDYTDFAKDVLAERKQAGLPPFAYQAILRAEALRQELAMHFLRRAAACADSGIGEVAVFDPVPANMARLAGKERAQLTVQSRSRTALHRFLNEWAPRLEKLAERNVRWALDVDPQES